MRQADRSVPGNTQPGLDAAVASVYYTVVSDMNTKLDVFADVTRVLIFVYVVYLVIYSSG